MISGHFGVGGRRLVTLKLELSLTVLSMCEQQPNTLTFCRNLVKRHNVLYQAVQSFTSCGDDGLITDELHAHRSRRRGFFTISAGTRHTFSGAETHSCTFDKKEDRLQKVSRDLKMCDIAREVVPRQTTSDRAKWGGLFSTMLLSVFDLC